MAWQKSLAARLVLCLSMLSLVAGLPASLAGDWNFLYASAQTPDQDGAANAQATNTFLAQGSINQLTPLFPESEQDTLFLLGGEWVLSVNNGTVDDFIVRIMMVAEDGTLPHVHTIQNLSNVTTLTSPISANQTGGLSIAAGANNTIVFSGFADITTNGITEWKDVAVTISLVNGNVMSVTPNPGEVDHFYGLPIYGMVASLVNKSGETLKSQTIGDVNGTFHGKGSITDYLEAGPQNNTSIPEDDSAFDISVLDSSESQLPVTQKVSDDGNYLVQMRWSQAAVYPLPAGMVYQVFFLNPEQPQATEEIVPSWESNFTGASTLRPYLFIDPSIIPNFEAVDTYDITVYSEAGDVLWQRDDRAVYGGRDQGQITFEENYRGPVSIEITDIKPLSGILDDPAPAPDSVTFTSFFVR